MSRWDYDVHRFFVYYETIKREINRRGTGTIKLFFGYWLIWLLSFWGWLSSPLIIRQTVEIQYQMIWLSSHLTYHLIISDSAMWKRLQNVYSQIKQSRLKPLSHHRWRLLCHDKSEIWYVIGMLFSPVTIWQRTLYRVVFTLPSSTWLWKSSPIPTICSGIHCIEPSFCRAKYIRLHVFTACPENTSRICSFFVCVFFNPFFFGTLFRH